MANQHIFNNTLIITGSVTASDGFYGDGSGLTGITAVAEWDGSRDGNASITGSFVVSGSSPSIQLLGDTTIDENIEISNRNQTNDIAIGYQALPNTTYSGIGGVTRRAIAIGYQAATNLVSGSQNIFIGQCAGYAGVEVVNNLGIGFCALACSIGKDLGSGICIGNNVAIGANTLKEINAGYQNTAVGNSAGCSLTTGHDNVMIGNIAGTSTNTGFGNTFIGSSTGCSNQIGYGNTYIGDGSGRYATGERNTALGAYTLYAGASPINPITGDRNVAVGWGAGSNAECNSCNNVYIGYDAGPSTAVEQNYQLYIGVQEGETPLIRGDFNTGQLTINSQVSASVFSGSFVGDGSGLTNIPASEWDGTRNGDAQITGSLIVSGSTPTIQLLGDTTIDQNIEISNRNQTNDLAIGYQALPESTVTTRNTIAIGCQAGFFQVSGSNNIAIGINAACAGVRTDSNIAIGTAALRNNVGIDIGNPTTLSANIAIGNSALSNLTTGNKNLAVGYLALRALTTQGSNTGVGHCAGVNSTGLGNVLIGQDAGKYANSFNVVIGHQANFSGAGARNVLVGYQAGVYNAGDRNVALGTEAGKCATGTSKRNLYLGTCTGPSVNTTQCDQLYIGYGRGETPLLRGNVATGQLTIHSQVSASIFSGSFVGDGSGLTNVSGSGFPYTGTALITGSLIVSQSAAANTAVTVQNGHVILRQVSASMNYESDLDAAAGGVPLGGLYRSGNSVQIRIT